MDRNRFIQCMKSNIELSDKERRRIIRRSVESQPWKLKCTIAMEEFAELTQAISKQIRGYDNRIGLLEEMADAYICLEFLKSIFNITPEELQKAMDVMDQWKPLCEKYNCTIANLALAWILAQGDFINLLSGSTTVDQIAENVKSAELELDSADVAMMRDMVEAIDK